jgi:hypothetical protein
MPQEAASAGNSHGACTPNPSAAGEGGEGVRSEHFEYATDDEHKQNQAHALEVVSGAGNGIAGASQYWFLSPFPAAGGITVFVA